MSATCTGLTATWCAVHGDCVCARREDGEVEWDEGDSCPLHGMSSSHDETTDNEGVAMTQDENVQRTAGLEKEAESTQADDVGRTLPPYEYRLGNRDETPEHMALRLMENTLRAMAEIIQVAACEGSDAAVIWTMDYMEGQDSAQDEDYVAYERWTNSRRAVDSIVDAPVGNKGKTATVLWMDPTAPREKPVVREHDFVARQPSGSHEV